MYFLLFNRTTLQVFATHLRGALYVHPLWFYKHQHDNRFRSKLFVACQRWWFQWRFWFVPSVLEYLREEEEHKPDPWRNPIERNLMRLHLKNEVTVAKTPTIISNNPVYYVNIMIQFRYDSQESILVDSEIQLKILREMYRFLISTWWQILTLLIQGLIRTIKYTKTQIRLRRNNYTHRDNANILLIFIATEKDANYWSAEYLWYIQERANGCEQNPAYILTGKLVCYCYKDAI